MFSAYPDTSFLYLFFLHLKMNPLRSTLTKSRTSARTLFASGSILGATRVSSVRTMQNRAYSSEVPKKSGSGGLVFLSKFFFFLNNI